MRRAITIAPDRPDAYQQVGPELRPVGRRDRPRAAAAGVGTESGLTGYRVLTSLLFDLYDRKPESAMARLEDLSIDVFSLPDFGTCPENF